ncbi:error-prone DNA polymerase [Chelatococcus asaccharovorans]|uniref:Error-prone DNA polymerase n=1 Tax=Chelatococcus asaccharovorans TaxID=28210 RepID=A0A2V3U698_9HYPH|nr:error-prone DNA polymerase [Chelatococcus asaccharovorans]MBS7703862.1 error-prone DNA polymerase [Chelatococcus asaccharovorans]PXW58024.1 DnaE-like error-prone DNA polymerase [Chelatococcus asaccharovorans]
MSDDIIPPPLLYGDPVAATHFSFLRGTSHPAEMVRRAAELGQNGIGIADRNTVAGVVRAYVPVRDAARAYTKENAGAALPFKLLVGARLAFTDGTPDIVAYPADRDGWGRLCRLLTLGNRRGLKGECLLTRDDLIADTSNLLLILMPPRDIRLCADLLPVLAEAAPGALWLGATMPRGGADRRRLMALKALAEAHDVPLIATSDALYATPEERPLQDVVTCIREGLKIASAGRILEANAERHLKAPEEMARLFRDVPEAIAETQHLFARSDFCLSQLKYDYPEEPVPPGKTAQHHLEDLVWRRVALRYPKGTPAKVDALLRQELAFIAEQDYARYFLTIHDIVRFADDRGILCQGRGSAANSVVCFILGITNVDPEQINVLFARFLSKERDEPPDIDVDFEHERREEVIQHIYARYGRERAGIAATVICYRPRSAIREVGKVFGLSEDVTSALASTVWGSHGDELPEGHVRQAGHQPLNPEIARAVDFANRLMGAPRHLSQHVGGFILTRGRLDETVPIGNAAMPERTFIEWDRDDIDVLGLMKVDVLALGMLTCIRKALALLKDEKGIEQSLSSIEADDQEVYDMLCRGDSIGLFQVESRAQMSMLPRLKPRKFYDLVIQVAIVRPGPIQGNMVHPYLRRRAEKEAVVFPSPGPDYPQDELQQVLGDTLGVPLFQEQAMRLAIVAAAFTDDEANGLRRAMATFRHVGTINSFKAKMVEGMVRRGYARDFAERCFAQIEGFGSYGFPESHAAAFAHLVYISAWIKCYHPDVFACALLNSQPMGFYAPAQIVRDAAEHGIEVRAADINASHWDNTLEPCAGGKHALRLGLRQLDGFQKAWAEALARHRGMGFPDLEALARRTALPRRALEILADADSCRSIGLDRREAAWAVRRLPDSQPLPLFAAADAAELAAEPDVHLPAMPLAEHVITDYQTARLSLKAHPVHFLRPLYRREGLLSCEEVRQSRNGLWARTAGIVLVRQRPGKGNVVFMTIEDETGIANIVVWANLFARFRGEVMGARIIEIAGQIQRSEDDVVHVIARRLTDRSRDLGHLREGEGLQDDGAARRAARTGGHPRNVRILPRSRDFH